MINSIWQQQVFFPNPYSGCPWNALWGGVRGREGSGKPTCTVRYLMCEAQQKIKMGE